MTNSVLQQLKAIRADLAKVKADPALLAKIDALVAESEAMRELGERARAAFQICRDCADEPPAVIVVQPPDMMLADGTLVIWNTAAKEGGR